MVGGITRLTQSGLSIVDWQPLVGAIPPISEADWNESFERYRQSPEYRQLRPRMTLGEYKRIFFWEYLHRLLARAIALVFIVPFAYFYWTGALTTAMLRKTLALFALGATQGVIGWLMVYSGLIDRPSVSHYRLALHLVTALAIVGLALWLMCDLGPLTMPGTVTRVAKRRALGASLSVGAVLGLQIVYGAFVAGLKAGLAFNTFPLMGGMLVPSPYWTLTPAVHNFVEDPAGVQWMHRTLATLLLASAWALQAALRRLDLDARSIRLASALLLAIAAQYALGVLTLLFAVPLSLALPHQLMAALVVVLWVRMLHHLAHLPTPGVASNPLTMELFGAGGGDTRRNSIAGH